METLAPELLDNIFTLACIDGGMTGCSLSSVSKHVRVTSRAARFHSISLTGSSLQIEQFLTCFLAERAVAAIRTPTIRHLHLVSMQDERSRHTPKEELCRIEEESAKYVEDVAKINGVMLVHYPAILIVQSVQRYLIGRPKIFANEYKMRCSCLFISGNITKF